MLAALRNPRPILQGLGLRIGENVAFYVYTVFVASYAVKTLHYPAPTVIHIVTAAAIAQLVGMLLGGHCSDRIGRRQAMLLPAVGLLIWAPLFFILAQQGSVTYLTLAVLVGAFMHGLLAGPEAAWLTELFPTAHGYAGVSLVVQCSSMLAGAPAPLISVWLVSKYGWKVVVTYLAVTILITSVAVLSGSDTRGKELT